MMDIFQQRYYKINKFYLNSIGLWSYQSRRRRLLLIAFTVSVAVLYIPMQIISTFEFSDDPEIIAESTASTVTAITVVIKLVATIASSDKRMQIFRRIQMDWVSLDQNPAINILRKYAERGRKLTIAYSVGIYFVAILYGSPPMVSILAFMKLTNETLQKKLVFPVFLYGLDLDTYYYYLLASEYIFTMLFIVIVITVDTTFMVQVEHACGMFAVVGYQLQHIANERIEEYVNHSHSKLDPAYQNLTVCIVKHRDVIEFSKILEASYTWYFFMNSGIAMMSISYAGVQVLLMMTINPKEAISYGAVLIAFIVIVFWYCFFGQRLLDHSQQVGKYICQAKWYNTSLATQKLLNLVTMRTYVPCVLTIGKFMVLSLENYTLALRASMSYFTVMRSMQ